ncbi:alanine/glycine:cation symporter family protein [Tessaracoccus flavus]|jgi:AGCS family alanine or glycine:cation symporter|uniref:Sodium:alanine symporter family protein n=1 Tax=Tessaracoccus flavus TaxID=1610493 RepID=A0A1Q2CDV6_9ACTN|nr:alanine/glycine:cation symporter family protein [Tessaracoccus flavus]AQP44288.1 sodium:alanine symporter family protein [Tessaracoccus flavus]SDY40740.1 alanine or glycine:cation symporter, AGCS family [Tessaracoccus flavus]
MQQLQDILDSTASFVWGPLFLIPLLLLTGLWLTVRLRGIQFRTLGSAMRLALWERHDHDAEGGDISHFQALTTALAATVGVGNIVGVATAISIGGPGALFWMWVTGLVGMASKYSEAFLAVRFRTVDDKGEVSGGPQYYLKKALPGQWGVALSIIFAVFAVLASFGIGNMTQGNAVAANMEDAFGVPTQITAIVLAVFVGLVILGGIKVIGRVTAAFVPIMIVLYVLGALFILAVNITDVPGAFALIFGQAFTGQAATGGAIGGLMIAIQMGVARGIFSNESGMGSAAIAAAAAKTTHPVRQGLVSMTQTFIDTIIVVSCTGLVLVTTGVWEADANAAVLTSMAFSTGLPGNWGQYIVALGVVMFASSTILGWSYYGDRCVERLFGARATLAYRIVFTLVVYVGATIPLGIVWSFADVMNGLMALPNLIGLLILSGLIARETAHYLKNDPKLRAGRTEVDDFMADQVREA